MDNYEAIAYAVIALKELQKENLETNSCNLKARMLYLMDKYSESEIYKMYEREG